MRILVDADACPVKEIIVELAKRSRIPVAMLTDTSHELNDSVKISLQNHSEKHGLSGE